MEDLIPNVNSNSSNWTWPQGRKDSWRPADAWQEFADRWRNAEAEALHPDSQILNLGPCLGTIISVDRLFIRKCYVQAEELVWKWATLKPHTGVIITGQPGIGKTVFIWYLLVSLLQKKQVILLHASGDSCVLFYHGAVYTSKPGDVSASTLPFPSTNLTPSPFIWSLFDIDQKVGPPAVATATRWCFPVQAPSPNRNRYEIWQKDRTPFFTGFPLWTREELAACAPIYKGFPPIKQFLVGAVKRWKDENVEEKTFPGVFRFLKATYGEDAPNSVDHAFGILLDALIKHFGPIPRDIFSAMDNFYAIEQPLVNTLQIGYNELKDAVTEVATHQQILLMGCSHHIFSLDCA